MVSSDEPQSLKSIFQAAEDQRRVLEITTLPATSPAYRSELDDALALYARARDQLSRVAIFSPNEAAEDIATADLPYLLLDFHYAELVQRTPGLKLDERADVLASSRAAYERFLALVDGYSLVSAPYDRLVERYRDDPNAFAVVAGSDMAARREGKIANYKAEKQLKEKLEVLRRNPRYLDHGDEEIVRELHLTHLTFAVHTTMQALDSLNREFDMIAQAPRPDPESDSVAAKPDSNDTRLDQPLGSLTNRGGPLLSTQGKPLQPFTLVGSRTDRTRGVFRSGHNLPTMSIDEYLDEEKRRGNILQGGVEEKPVVDEDDMEAADQATYKARAWDEFTDHNPKGAGNTLNRG
ncbi:TAP42-like protein [Ilyonectria robusta]|uniref:TAP42-like protein n=1 Tax=Ilyonectria robusta TaxID=1079257 RepID=UPI001E8DF893|nr:TAP42-like protein [Ilyonectria robusta]KAH8735747.1 TAP42-like protein [Ilyonectria robusta]